MSTGFQSSTPEYLKKASIYSAELKEVLQDPLITEGYVKILTDFPDGDTFNIPSLGEFLAQDYSENDAIKFTSADTGNFQFSIDKYIQVNTFITDKMKQDAYLYNQVASAIPGKFQMAIKRHWEETILGLQSTQTSGNANNINGYAHRLIGSGSNNTASLIDFQKMKLAFDKAHVPAAGRVAIVDGTVEYSLAKTPSTGQVHPNWEKVLPYGLGDGLRFVTHIAGFDVYESNRLATIASETIGGTTVTNAVANMFFSANPMSNTFIGAWRQAPTVEGDRNVNQKRDEYSMTARYGAKVYRTEALGVLLTTTTQSSL